VGVVLAMALGRALYSGVPAFFHDVGQYVPTAEEPAAAPTDAPAIPPIPLTKEEFQKLVLDEAKECESFPTWGSFKEIALQTRVFSSTALYICSGDEKLRADGIKNFHKWFPMPETCAKGLMNIEVKLLSDPSDSTLLRQLCGLFKSDPTYTQRVIQSLNNNPKPDWNFPD
jgi:hypothetical protein